MKMILRSTARAFIDVSSDLPPEQLGAVCDVVLAFLSHRGITARECMQFLSLVRESLLEQLPVAVSVTTSSGTLGSHAESLTHALERSLAHAVELQEHEDATLLGGARVRFSDERYDMSIRGALEQAHEALR